ncbi:unnamed protein product [Paramecium pentaurelia]|uniref:Uncharacterized protein n=1 Tax=Paramecium pentaurelia TaxID=43138 RepID=A0A8S1YI97_9CILI|nr:unnamed protein product [Paramecium pentaurelia]CAD8213660.1 unnamed protein product [Paramecium pentaurelia]
MQYQVLYAHKTRDNFCEWDYQGKKWKLKEQCQEYRIICLLKATSELPEQKAPLEFRHPKFVKWEDEFNKEFFIWNDLAKKISQIHSTHLLSQKGPRGGIRVHHRLQINHTLMFRNTQNNSNRINGRRQTKQTIKEVQQMNRDDVRVEETKYIRINQEEFHLEWLSLDKSIPKLINRLTDKEIGILLNGDGLFKQKKVQLINTK